MKLRTLIVDLDCPYGINHFQLLPCEDCFVAEEMKKNLAKTIVNPVPFAPADYKFEWYTKDSTDTTTITWDTGSGGASTASGRWYGSASAHASHYAFDVADTSFTNITIT